MDSTMQDAPLLLRDIVRHGETLYANKRVFTITSEGPKEATFFEVIRRAERLANALTRLGIQRGDRVASLLWNNQTHMEAYIAVPTMGAVLHTLNLRLFPEQLTYIINHGEDRVIIVDPSVAPTLAGIRDQISDDIVFILNGPDPTNSLPDALDYETLLEAERPGFDWPDLDERDGAILCYTSGTTGNPKGVVYSHRSTWLHSLGSMTANSSALSERDRCLVIVPMFHVNAWGTVYTALFAGTELIMPQMYLQGEPIVEMVRELRPTISLAVPSVWNDVLRVAENDPTADFSSFRTILVGGSAVPRSLIIAFKERFGVDLIQGWGMTETSPLAAVSLPPMGTPTDQEIDYRVKSGRIVAGVQVRLVGEAGEILPNDGKSVGEIEIRGPWITGSYFGVDSPDSFHDGWLRTGDVATIDGLGYIQITDRSKDLIKSGGEWISSVELEGQVMAHPGVFEAVVVAVHDDRWEERPLCCVVRAPGSEVTFEELREFLVDRVAKWWIPERWAFIDAVPKTSVGKFDKKVLRQQYADGLLDVVYLK